MVYPVLLMDIATYKTKSNMWYSMRKLTVFISGDSETLDLPEPFSLDKHILVKKVTIFWEYHNVGKNETHYYTIKKVGTVISSLVR